MEFRVEGKTLLKQFNQFLKNLEKNASFSPNCLRYETCAGSLHRVCLLKIKRCKTASFIFPWEKKQQYCPIFFQSHFHTQPNTSQLCQMCFPSQVKWMEGVTRQPALQDAGSWEQEPSWENEYPSVGRRKWAKQKIPSQPNHHAELFWFMLLAAFLSAQWHTLKIFAVWTRFHV